MTADVPPLFAELHGTGPAVVLIHGQPGSSADWRRVVPLLATDHRVIVPDRLGYGRTGGTAAGFSANAAALVALLDDLSIPRAVLTGFSWGGGIAIAAAQRFPQRVAGLVLVSSVGPGEPLRWDDRLLATPLIGDALAALALGATGRILGLHKVQELVDHRLAGRARDAITTLSSLTGPRTWRSFVVEQRALLSELDMLGPALGGVRAPVAILNGTSDRIVPPVVGERLAAEIPDATHTVVDGARHLLILDHPDAVAAAVRKVTRRAETS